MDTFLKLLTNPDSAYCDARYLGVEKYLHPITGSVGLAKTINQFINLTLFDSLTGPVNSQGDRGPPTMVDKLVFTTKLSGSVTPKVVLTPVGMGFQLLDAALGLAASRNDIHTLNVALALAKPQAVTVGASVNSAAGKVRPAGSPVLSSGAFQVPGTVVTSLLFINAAGTPSEILAAQALNQAILRFEVGKASGAVVIPVP